MPADLKTHALIGYLGDVTTAPWCFTANDGQTSELQCKCRFMANNTAVMMEVALPGFGIVYGPSFVVAPRLAPGDLVAVLPSYSNPVLPIHAITPTAKHVNVKTRMFIERLKLAFGKSSPWE